jgi:hypothetical protein
MSVVCMCVVWGWAGASTRLAADGTPVPSLPEHLVAGLFANHTSLSVSKEALARVHEACVGALPRPLCTIVDTADGVCHSSHDYWEQAAGDVAAYAAHAHRNTIEASDVACLFERSACVRIPHTCTHIHKVPLCVCVLGCLDGASVAQGERTDGGGGGVTRQRLTTQRTTLEDLARQLLPREYVEELVPVAHAHNRIQPKQPVRP